MLIIIKMPRGRVAAPKLVQDQNNTLIKLTAEQVKEIQDQEFDNSGLVEFQTPSTDNGKAFVFTWNNYPDDHADVVERLGTRYHCYGYETCPTTGTEHLQGFVYFNMPKSFTAVRRGLLGSHVSIAKGSVAQNITYCSKEECFLEFGERPMSQELKGSNEQKRWASAYECAQKGLISEIPGDIAIRCYANIKRIESDFMAIVPNSREPCGVWIHGESGAGKSYSVHFRYPGLYNKMRNKWWDGYRG